MPLTHNSYNRHWWQCLAIQSECALGREDRTCAWTESTKQLILRRKNARSQQNRNVTRNRYLFLFAGIWGTKWYKIVGHSIEQSRVEIIGAKWHTAVSRFSTARRVGVCVNFNRSIWKWSHWIELAKLGLAKAFSRQISCVVGGKKDGCFFDPC